MGPNCQPNKQTHEACKSLGKKHHAADSTNLDITALVYTQGK